MSIISRVLVFALSIALLSLGAGCADCGRGDCTPGTLDCPCTSSGACGLGLTCQANKCVHSATGSGGATVPASGVANGTGGASGAGGSTRTGGTTTISSGGGAAASGGAADSGGATGGGGGIVPDAAMDVALGDAPSDRSISPGDGPATIEAAGEAALPAGPTTYYVATTGSDQAAGTLVAPWKTIQRCATLARPGDTCAIRAGTYRETVTPVRSGTADGHITFTAYDGECVTVSGADVLNVTWQPYQGSTYMADTSLRFIQLFAGGKMLNEARWPNADPDDLVHMPLAQAGPATSETSLEGSTLPAGDWTGAYVFTIPGQRWVSYTRKIESYDPAKKIATWTTPVREPTAAPELAPRARDTYYVFGSLLALDSAGEWFLDSATGKLYLWAPGAVDPGTLKIEVKQRDYGFNLGARAYVDIKGVRLFATSVRMTGASHCVVDGVHARYISHLRETNGYRTGRADQTSTWTATGAGLVLNLSNPGGSTVGVSLHAEGADGGVSRSWCVQPASFGSPMFIPWEKFNSKCWDNSGAFYAQEPLNGISVNVGAGLADVPFNFCLDGIAPKLDTGDGSVESPLMAIRGGNYLATAAWEGSFSSWSSPGSTLTLSALSTVGTSNKVCASGTVKGTADYSGNVGFGFNLAERNLSSTAPAPDGDFDEWKNGSIAFAATAAIVAAGSDAKINNNVVRDTGYMAVGNGGISIENWSSFPPARSEISDNTVSRTGRMGITNYGDVAARILSNRVSHANQIIDDGGLIYTYGTAATSAEIAYNHVSDITCVYGTGIYLDDGAKGYTVHHNFVHDVSWTGVVLWDTNRFFNNTILRTPLGAGSIAKAGNKTWVDFSTAVFSNNLIEQRPGIAFAVQQKQTTDYADYQIIVPVTGQWQKVVLPFSSLRQPNWGIRTSLDLTNLTALAWVTSTLGAYQIDLDDVWLEGTTPKLLDDFDGATTNRLGGSWLANCGSGSTCAKATSPGYAGNAFTASGNAIREGYAQILTFLAADGTSPVDLSAYTGISFRIRGTATLNLSNGTASTTPIQEHNLDCPVDANGVPTSSCPVDQGGLFSPYTDGYSGAAPDVGAFESGRTPWTAGSTTIEPTELCPS
jgi:hypothetical protein